jgi:hypothetical protein
MSDIKARLFALVRVRKWQIAKVDSMNRLAERWHREEIFYRQFGEVQASAFSPGQGWSFCPGQGWSEILLAKLGRLPND